jgi:hypothetical protein
MYDCVLLLTQCYTALLLYRILYVHAHCNRAAKRNVESAEAGRYKRTIEALQAQLAANGIAPAATYSALTVATSTAASGRYATTVLC